MKIKAFIALAAIATTSAFAGEHKAVLKARMDLRGDNRDYAKTGVGSNSAFSAAYARTQFKGDVNDSGVSYKLTLNLVKASEANKDVNGTSGFLDEASLKFKMGDALSLTAGKQYVLLGGREFDWSLRDLYATSVFFASAPSKDLGATVTYSVAGQDFNLQVFNGNKRTSGGEGTTNGSTSMQSKMGYGITWYGNLMDGMIKPIAGYTIMPRYSATASDREDVMMALGAQFNVSNFVIEADYDSLNKKKAISTSVDTKVTSMYGYVSYKMDMVSPWFKYISSEEKNYAVNNDKRETTVMELGAQFKHSEGVKFNVVYDMSEVETTSAAGVKAKSEPKSMFASVVFDTSLI